MPEPPPQLHARRAARPLGRAAPAVPTVLLVLAVLPLGWAALATLARLLSYPYPHDGLEGTLLHEARLLWAGQPLYQPLERFRFVSAPYPPLHPLLLGLADTIAGPHVFWGGRLISLAAALGVLLLIVLMCRRTGASWLGGIVGGAIMLSAPPLLLWATRIKLRPAGATMDYAGPGYARSCWPARTAAKVLAHPGGKLLLRWRFSPSRQPQQRRSRPVWRCCTMICATPAGARCSGCHYRGVRRCLAQPMPRWRQAPGSRSIWFTGFQFSAHGPAPQRVVVCRAAE
ncbi:MAG: hypothetical protein U0Z44_03360 [Kouleothrix sp.]